MLGLLVAFPSQMGSASEMADPFVGKAMNVYMTGLNESGRLLLRTAVCELYGAKSSPYRTNEISVLSSTLWQKLSGVLCGFLAWASHLFHGRVIPLLWAGSRDSTEKITAFGTPNRLNHCVIFVRYT
jgi:hypothetical protein